MTQRTFTGKTGDVWTWEETPETIEALKQLHNTVVNNRVNRPHDYHSSSEEPEFTDHQWKLIFTALKKYQLNYPQHVSCYTEMHKDLSEIIQILETHISNELNHEH